MNTSLTTVYNYHDATKHHFGRYAKSLGFMDWDRQPDPFRTYQGAEQISLARIEPTEHPAYDDAFKTGAIPALPLTHQTISRLFFDSMALSGWKKYGDQIVSKRVNPSSGNLHPTESYLICGVIDGVTEKPMVCHYAPKTHVLEKRAELSTALWEQLTHDLPQGAILIGLSSIYWRESWKYGERAFRYCQHDVGHALGAIAVAAAGLGWETRLVDDLGSEQMRLLMGLPDEDGPETEHPDCVVAIFPRQDAVITPQLGSEAIPAFAALNWQGTPNVLSPSHVAWPIIDHVSDATVKPATTEPAYRAKPSTPLPSQRGEQEHRSLREIVRKRRSAIDMDGETRISRDRFYNILSRMLAGTDNVPFHVLPWEPLVHLLLFVHRVDDLVPGVYLLVRNPESEQELRGLIRQEFTWTTPPGCPDELPLYLLTPAEAKDMARSYSCGQDIASDGCFSLGMIAEFERPLSEYGAWFYPRLYWESGLIGQMLYLEAEAAPGLRGTGIGCFMDDPVHRLLGIKGIEYQDLYHFTVGGPVEDPRMTMDAAYGDES